MSDTKWIVGNNPLYAYANVPYEDVLETTDGFTIADLERSRLQLQRVQLAKGACMLIAKGTVQHLHELHQHQRALFLNDMVRVGEALQNVFNADSINYHIMGDNPPHLHVNIIPTYANPPPSKHQLDVEEYAQIIGDIRESLGFIRERVNVAALYQFLDNQGRVKYLPMKKNTEGLMAILLYFATKFDLGKTYTEAEVNAIIEEWTHDKDYATIRRELIGRNLLARESDGSAYWLLEEINLAEI